MKCRNYVGVLLAAVLALPLASACVSQTVIDDGDVFGPSPNGPGGPSASPSPAPGCATAIDSVRVAPFGFECTSADKPNNSAGVLPLTCTARVTATPKGKFPGNGDVPAEIHGPNITWTLRTGTGNVEVLDDPTQPFNKNVSALKVGSFSLSATVCGVEGSYNGLVVPEDWNKS